MQLEALVCLWRDDKTDMDKVAEEAYAQYGVNVGYRKETGPEGSAFLFLHLHFSNTNDEDGAYNVLYMVLELFDKPPDVSYIGNINYVKSPFGYFIYK